MKVLITAYCVDKNDISEPRMAYEWISRLSRHATLWVVTTGSRLHTTCGLESMDNVHLVHVKQHLSFQWADAFDRAVHPGYLEYFIRSQKKIKTILQNESIDAGHHLSPRSPRYPSPLMNFDLPYIVGPFHGGLKSPPVMNELLFKESLFFKLRKLDDFRLRHDPFLKKHYQKAARIVISAEYVKNILPGNTHEKIRIIPPPPSSPIADAYPGYRSPQNRQGPLQMLYVGRIAPSKGLELLMEALGQCRDMDWTLNIYGKGPCQESYQKYAESLGIGHSVNWHGFVNQQQLWPIYKQADVFVFPSLREPTGGALIEAMGMGLPILCIDYGGPSSFVTESCGCKVPLGDRKRMVQDLSNAIRSLAVDGSKRESMSYSSWERIKNHFGWESAVSAMLDLYREVGQSENRGKKDPENRPEIAQSSASRK